MHILDFFLHVDKHLRDFVLQYGSLVYALLFGIIFCETGLVILPFLPGDSLLFAAGALAANPALGLNPALLAVLLFGAALCGDNVNYMIGRFFGKRLFESESKLFNRANLTKTEAFFVKYGGQAIIRARFVPIVRTFAPFTAGVGQMEYPKFLLFSVIAAALWVGVCMGFGYFFGNLPPVQKHFDLFALGVIVISLIPIAVEMLQHRSQSMAEAAKTVGADK
jgi:membrane-associated protein